MSNNLNLPQLFEGQNAPEVTANDANAALDAALTEVLSVDLTNNVSITDAQWRTCSRVTLTSVGAGGKDLTIPAIKRRVIIYNADAADVATLKVGTTTYALPADKWCEVLTDGTADGMIVLPYGQAGIPEGGSSNYVLAKTSGTDYDVAWIEDTHYAPIGINNRTASYSLVTTDAGQLVEMNVGSACTVTVPANADQAFAIGDVVEVVQMGTGQVTFTPDTGVTLYSVGGKTKTTDQYSAATLVKRATNTWYLFGDIAS